MSFEKTVKLDTLRVKQILIRLTNNDYVGNNSTLISDGSGGTFWARILTSQDISGTLNFVSTVTSLQLSSLQVDGDQLRQHLSNSIADVRSNLSLNTVEVNTVLGALFSAVDALEVKYSTIKLKLQSTADFTSTAFIQFSTAIFGTTVEYTPTQTLVTILNQYDNDVRSFSTNVITSLSSLRAVTSTEASKMLEGISNTTLCNFQNLSTQFAKGNSNLSTLIADNVSRISTVHRGQFSTAASSSELFRSTLFSTINSATLSTITDINRVLPASTSLSTLIDFHDDIKNKLSTLYVAQEVSKTQVFINVSTTFFSTISTVRGTLDIGLNALGRTVDLIDDAIATTNSEFEYLSANIRLLYNSNTINRPQSFYQLRFVAGNIPVSTFYFSSIVSEGRIETLKSTAIGLLLSTMPGRLNLTTVHIEGEENLLNQNNFSLFIPQGSSRQTLSNLVSQAFFDINTEFETLISTSFTQLQAFSFSNYRFDSEVVIRQTQAGFVNMSTLAQSNFAMASRQFFSVQTYQLSSMAASSYWSTALQISASMLELFQPLSTLVLSTGSIFSSLSNYAIYNFSSFASSAGASSNFVYLSNFTNVSTSFASSMSNFSTTRSTGTASVISSLNEVVASVSTLANQGVSNFSTYNGLPAPFTAFSNAAMFNTYNLSTATADYIAPFSSMIGQSFSSLAATSEFVISTITENRIDTIVNYSSYWSDSAPRNEIMEHQSKYSSVYDSLVFSLDTCNAAILRSVTTETNVGISTLSSLTTVGTFQVNGALISNLSAISTIVNEAAQQLSSLKVTTFQQLINSFNIGSNLQNSNLSFAILNFSTFFQSNLPTTLTSSYANISSYYQFLEKQTTGMIATGDSNITSTVVSDTRLQGLSLSTANNYFASSSIFFKEALTTISTANDPKYMSTSMSSLSTLLNLTASLISSQNSIYDTTIIRFSTVICNSIENISSLTTFYLSNQSVTTMVVWQSTLSLISTLIVNLIQRFGSPEDDSEEGNILETVLASYVTSYNQEIASWAASTAKYAPMPSTILDFAISNLSSYNDVFLFENTYEQTNRKITVSTVHNFAFSVLSNAFDRDRLRRTASTVALFNPLSSITTTTFGAFDVSPSVCNIYNSGFRAISTVFFERLSLTSTNNILSNLLSVGIGRVHNDWSTGSGVVLNQFYLQGLAENQSFLSSIDTRKTVQISTFQSSYLQRIRDSTTAMLFQYSELVSLGISNLSGSTFIPNLQQITVLQSNVTTMNTAALISNTFEGYQSTTSNLGYNLGLLSTQINEKFVIGLNAFSFISDLSTTLGEPQENFARNVNNVLTSSNLQVFLKNSGDIITSLSTITMKTEEDRAIASYILFSSVLFRNENAKYERVAQSSIQNSLDFMISGSNVALLYFSTYPDLLLQDESHRYYLTDLRNEMSTIFDSSFTNLSTGVGDLGEFMLKKFDRLDPHYENILEMMSDAVNINAQNTVDTQSPPLINILTMSNVYLSSVQNNVNDGNVMFNAAILDATTRMLRHEQTYFENFSTYTVVDYEKGQFQANSNLSLIDSALNRFTEDQSNISNLQFQRFRNFIVSNDIITSRILDTAFSTFSLSDRRSYFVENFNLLSNTMDGFSTFTGKTSNEILESLTNSMNTRLGSISNISNYMMINLSTYSNPDFFSFEFFATAVLQSMYSGFNSNSTIFTSNIKVFISNIDTQGQTTGRLFANFVNAGEKIVLEGASSVQGGRADLQNLFDTAVSNSTTGFYLHFNKHLDDLTLQSNVAISNYRFQSNVDILDQSLFTLTNVQTNFLASTAQNYAGVQEVFDLLTTNFGPSVSSLGISSFQQLTFSLSNFSTYSTIVDELQRYKLLENIVNASTVYDRFFTTTSSVGVRSKVGFTQILSNIQFSTVIYSDQVTTAFSTSGGANINDSSVLLNRMGVISNNFDRNFDLYRVAERATSNLAVGPVVSAARLIESGPQIAPNIFSTFNFENSGTNRFIWHMFSSIEGINDIANVEFGENFGNKFISNDTGFLSTICTLNTFGDSIFFSVMLDRVRLESILLKEQTNLQVTTRDVGRILSTNIIGNVSTISTTMSTQFVKDFITLSTNFNQSFLSNSNLLFNTVSNSYNARIIELGARADNYPLTDFRERMKPEIIIYSSVISNYSTFLQSTITLNRDMIFSNQEITFVCTVQTAIISTASIVVQEKQFSRSYVYSNLQKTQEFVVSPGIEEVFVQVWGAGGARGYNTNGGGGAYVEGVYRVSSGERLYLQPGEGGKYFSVPQITVNAFGGGGRGVAMFSGGGGGASRVFKLSSILQSSFFLSTTSVLRFEDNFSDSTIVTSTYNTVSKLTAFASSLRLGGGPVSSFQIAFNFSTFIVSSISTFTDLLIAGGGGGGGFVSTYKQPSEVQVVSSFVRFVIDNDSFANVNENNSLNANSFLRAGSDGGAGGLTTGQLGISRYLSNQLFNLSGKGGTGDRVAPVNCNVMFISVGTRDLVNDVSTFLRTAGIFVPVLQSTNPDLLKVTLGSFDYVNYVNAGTTKKLYSLVLDETRLATFTSFFFDFFSGFNRGFSYSYRVQSRAPVYAFKKNDDSINIMHYLKNTFNSLVEAYGSFSFFNYFDPANGLVLPFIYFYDGFFPWPGDKGGTNITEWYFNLLQNIVSSEFYYRLNAFYGFDSGFDGLSIEPGFANNNLYQQGNFTFPGNIYLRSQETLYALAVSTSINGVLGSLLENTGQLILQAMRESNTQVQEYYSNSPGDYLQLLLQEVVHFDTKRTVIVELSTILIVSTNTRTFISLVNPSLPATNSTGGAGLRFAGGGGGGLAGGGGGASVDFRGLQNQLAFAIGGGGGAGGTSLISPEMYLTTNSQEGDGKRPGNITFESVSNFSRLGFGGFPDTTQEFSMANYTDQIEYNDSIISNASGGNGFMVVTELVSPYSYNMQELETLITSNTALAVLPSRNEVIVNKLICNSEQILTAFTAVVTSSINVTTITTTEVPTTSLLTTTFFSTAEYFTFNPLFRSYSTIVINENCNIFYSSLGLNDPFIFGFFSTMDILSNSTFTLPEFSTSFDIVNGLTRTNLFISSILISNFATASNPGYTFRSTIPDTVHVLNSQFIFTSSMTVTTLALNTTSQTATFANTTVSVMSNVVMIDANRYQNFTIRLSSMETSVILPSSFTIGMFDCNVAKNFQTGKLRVEICNNYSDENFIKLSNIFVANTFKSTLVLTQLSAILSTLSIAILIGTVVQPMNLEFGTLYSIFSSPVPTSPDYMVTNDPYNTTRDPAYDFSRDRTNPFSINLIL